MTSIFQPRLLDGKTVFVTGGSSGIGLRIAERFAEHSACVMLVARNQEKLDSAKASIEANRGIVGAVAVDPFAHRNYPLYGFTGPRLRDNALLVALLMEELAGPAREDASAAYTAGLFRSLGKLALATIADEHAPVVPFQSASTSSLVAWEKFTFGLPGNQATAIILQEWRFPGPVTQAIEEHYAPAGHAPGLARLLNLAASLAEQLGHGLPGESACWLDQLGSDHLPGIGPRQLQRASERAVAAFDRINRALG